jgi:peroxiredoxin
MVQRPFGWYSATAVSTTRRKHMEVQAGTAAPDFTLGAHNSDQKITLSSYKGRPVVVAFMPFAFTGG